MYKFIIPAFLLVILCVNCKQDYPGQRIEASSENKVQSVTTIPLIQSTEPIPIEASGMIGSKEEITLSFKIGGIIEQMLVDQGQRVKKGQLLAKLKTTEIDAQVLKAQQGVEKGQRDVTRINNLYADSVATLEQVQDLNTVLQLAEADLKIATFNREYAKIIAPSSGRIIKKFTERNELTSPGSPIFQLGTTGKGAFVMKIGIADKDIVRLKLYDKATVQLDAIPNHTFDAYVSEIAEAADPRTGVFEIELTIKESSTYQLRSGFIGRVQVYPSKQDAYYKIDMDALVEGYQDKANIYIPVGSTANKRVVKPDYIGSDFFTVSADQLKDVEEVITGGAAYLKDNQAIKIQQKEHITAAH